MTTFRRQLRYLLWKNILIKKRQKVWLAIELLVPVLLFAILALVRTRDFTIASTHCHYDSKAFPSAGLLPFAHSLLCSISNECYLSPTTGDEAAQINNATAQNESIVVDFLYYSTMQLNWIGKNPVEFQKFAEEVTSLINLIADMNMTSFQAPTQFNHLFRDPTAASNSTAASLNLPSELTAKLFTATPQQEFFRQIENVTPFDKMQKKLVEYIEKVVPGEESDQNKTCLNVTVHHQNCSSMNSFFLRQLKPMLQGYILVTPDNSAVRELVNLLNEPLRLFAYVRDQLFDYPEMAPDLQLALQNSQLNKAAENILLYLNGSHPLPPIIFPFLKPFKFFLEHAFKGIDDPYSLGNLTGSAVRQVDQFLDCVLVDRFRIVSNASELEETAVCLQQYGQYFSGLVFDFSNSTGEYFTEDTTYQIRHVSSMVDTTNDVTDGSRNIFDRNMPFRDLKYITYGFSFLQEAVDRALIELTTGIKPEMGIYAQQEPYPCVFKDSFNVENFLGLFVLLSFIVPAMLLVKNIVYEKEQKLKEHMRIMGLGDAIHFLSWASVSFVLNVVSVILISVLLVYGNIYPNTDITLLLVFFTLFVFSSISFSALLTTFFTNANISAAITCVVYFLFFYPFYLSKKNKDSTFTKFTVFLKETFCVTY
ncbi:hypothetical protein WR25_00690 [Diploscapter pachys]|uniref:ABC-2 type transporter transmembrane domain-containing protein n=1 Tax=Diploscapter pachys TaxID=2018661 RepID=A0A2A2J9R4_9BILA|nr:hypothetical protein WR25_00690 [Diploscapter pachys]